MTTSSFVVILYGRRTADVELPKKDYLKNIPKKQVSLCYVVFIISSNLLLKYNTILKTLLFAEVTSLCMTVMLLIKNIILTIRTY